MLYFFDLTVAAYVAVVVLKRVADAHDAVVRQERRQLTLRAELASAQLSYLETQLQPHFLFNSLGAVLELAHEAPVTAARMLRQLAALLRFAVHGRGQTVTLAQELGALEPYLEIQRLRFADWLTSRDRRRREALRCEGAAHDAAADRRERDPPWAGGTNGARTHRDRRRRSTRGVLRLTVSDNGVGLGAGIAPRPRTSRGSG